MMTIKQALLMDCLEIIAKEVIRQAMNDCVGGQKKKSGEWLAQKFLREESPLASDERKGDKTYLMKLYSAAWRLFELHDERKILT